jgi:hypothetical protein
MDLARELAMGTEVPVYCTCSLCSPVPWTWLESWPWALRYQCTVPAACALLYHGPGQRAGHGEAVEEAAEDVCRALGPQLLSGVEPQPVLLGKDLAKALADGEGYDGDGDSVQDDLRDKLNNRSSADISETIHCKKGLAVFPSPAGMSLTKLSLAGNNSIFPGQGEFVTDIPAGDVKTTNLFLQCISFLLCSLADVIILPWVIGLQEGQQVWGTPQE